MIDAAGIFGDEAALPLDTPAADAPLRALRWIGGGADPAAVLTRVPAECLAPLRDPGQALRVEVQSANAKLDVILCDLMMPDIAGMDVYDAIRRARPGVEERFVSVLGVGTHDFPDPIRKMSYDFLDKWHEFFD